MNFTTEQLEKALTLPRNTKRRLQPEDKARNDKHVKLAQEHGMTLRGFPKPMATFDDDGELVSLNDVEWFMLDQHPELGAYQFADEAALAYCRHNSLGEYEKVSPGGVPQGDDAMVGDQPRDAGVVDQHVVETIVDSNGVARHVLENIVAGSIQPIEAKDIRINAGSVTIQEVPDAEQKG